MTDPIPEQISRIYAQVLPVLERASSLALHYFRTSLQVDNKLGEAGFDPVTRADREIEQMVRQSFDKIYPDDGFIGEEFGRTRPNSPRQWILDPIDGTRSFMTGATGWGILLGLIIEGQPQLGFMVQPYLEEVFIGTGDSAELRRRGEHTRLEVSRQTHLDDAILYSTHPEMFGSKDNLNRFNRVAEQVKLMRFGGDCYSYVLLSMGLVDLIIEDSLQPYDIMPLVPIIEGAGGVVTDIKGQVPSRGGLVIAAATVELHQQAMQLMRR